MMSIPLKRCSKCGIEKPATTEFFHLAKREYDGFQPYCKPCRRVYRQLQRARKPQIRERDILRSQKRRQDPVAREHDKQRQREYLKTPDIRKRTNNRVRERIAKNPELREYRNQKKREWETNHPEQVKITNSRSGKKWRENNRLSHAIKEQRRRARKKNAEGFYTTDDVQKQYRSQNGKCWHCGKALNGKYHIDHLIPLNRGGTNWPNNIVCSCAHCNQSRGAKLTYEWNGKLL